MSNQKIIHYNPDSIFKNGFCGEYTGEKENLSPDFKKVNCKKCIQLKPRADLEMKAVRVHEGKNFNGYF